jgi:5-methylcytosine-specific restriction endonuclease McrA
MMTNARELTTRLAELLRREHAAMADFLLELADFDEKRLWVELGHSSLFYFLHRELGLSKGAAHYRMVAAGLVRRFPEIVEPMRDGRLCITSVIELARVLTPENREEVLPRFFHCSSREAKVVSAELRPREAPPRHDVVTVVAGCDATKAPPDVAKVEPHRPVTLVQSIEPREVLARHVAHDQAEPLTADLRRLHVTVSAKFVEKLEAARAALSHARPSGSMEEVLEAGLDALLQQHAKRKGLVERPRRQSRPSKADHVPAAVRRAVWTRDEGRCQWPLESGGLCGSTLRVEFDHVVPLARGGPSTEANVRLLCKMHNQLAARRAFGDAWMDKYHRPAIPPSATAS